MTEITVLLRAALGGDRLAADQAYALLYADLRRLARSRLRQSSEMTLLDTTALVHESFLRLNGGRALDFPDRHHFLAYAAKVMRAVVVDVVRARLAERRGGDAEHVTLNTTVVDAGATREDEVLRVHEALDELGALEPRLAQVVELRYFGGLSEAEVAASLGLTERTVQRDWQKARLLLSLALR
ncbi:MAG TPA: ECF-type sigma factor [Aquabacterium sp.]|nr:ECF-type sigma factor [Aquabacterium sp.]